ncbi:MAG: translation elongation factor Ts [Acidimicrobiales bacterium]|jgi:elongation factor Ts
MAAISAREVQELRKKTGAGILDVRRALEEADGDQAEAERLLREKGIISAAKRQTRERTQGAVAVVVEGDHSPVGAIAMLECETDFVAKSPEFVSLVEEIANELAEKGEQAPAEFSDRIEDLAVILKENIALGRTVRFAAPEGAIIGSYLHLQNGRGVNAVLVELTGGDEALAHELALHIAFARPEYLRREDVPAELVEEFRQTAIAIAQNEGKPAAALDKIVEGRLQGWFKERVLLEQPFVRDEQQTIAQLVGAKTQVLRFAQAVVGS